MNGRVSWLSTIFFLLEGIVSPLTIWYLVKGERIPSSNKKQKIVESDNPLDPEETR